MDLGTIGVLTRSRSFSNSRRDRTIAANSRVDHSPALLSSLNSTSKLWPIVIIPTSFLALTTIAIPLSPAAYRASQQLPPLLALIPSRPFVQPTHITNNPLVS
ncbi:hypothetical protein FRC12_014710 [Ceratobasidium sp. 428]|nr:hypothetical protein FRC12_014710 [Ceratobasidium sp. 428]